MPRSVPLPSRVVLSVAGTRGEGLGARPASADGKEVPGAR